MRMKHNSANLADASTIREEALLDSIAMLPALMCQQGLPVCENLDAFVTWMVGVVCHKCRLDTWPRILVSRPDRTLDEFEACQCLFPFRLRAHKLDTLQVATGEVRKPAAI